MTLKRRRNIKASRREMNTINNCDWRPWSELPEGLVDLISKRLNVIDYLAFGGVCTTWRSIVGECKQDFMASQPPLIVHISRRAKRTCSFYDIFNGKTYKTMLPHFAGKLCTGISCGYLIMQGKEGQLWLVNPFTRHEINFPSPPHRFDGVIPDRVILASSKVPSPEFVIVLVSKSHSKLLLCGSRDANWTVYSYIDERCGIADAVVFKGKIYALTDHARIVVLNRNSHPNWTPLEVKSISGLSPNLHFVASDEQLLMVDVLLPDLLEVYKLDFLRMEWVKMESLGDQALFLHDRKCSLISNPTRWGGRSNCIYHVGFIINRCSVYSLDGRMLESFPIVGGQLIIGSINPFLWCFPHQCYASIDSLHDD